MTPAQSIVHEAAVTKTVADKSGRRILLRRLTALDTLRLFKAAGPVLAQNEPWLSMAGLAFSVLEIDGVPIPAPTTETQIEGVIERLGDAGLAAVADTLKDEPDQVEWQPQLGN
jgi:hypothetical protein